MAETKLAPIVLFAYARPKHLALTLDALKADPLASFSDLYIFLDGARSIQDQDDVYAVHALTREISGFASVRCIVQKRNKGLSRSIIDGVSEMLETHERVIVLEDDLVVSPYFLGYMNEALNRFANDDRVISVHGYVYPLAQKLPEAFFLQGADCWGWGTWRRGWKLFNPDGKELLQGLKRRNLINVFDLNGAYRYSKMLKSQIAGKNDSWAVRWHASAFLANKLTLYPGRSLVHNIGNDSSGTHCNSNIIHDTALSETPIDLSRIEVRHSEYARKAFESFFRKSRRTMIDELQFRVRRILSWVLT